MSEGECRWYLGISRAAGVMGGQEGWGLRGEAAALESGREGHRVLIESEKQAQQDCCLAVADVASHPTYHIITSKGYSQGFISNLNVQYVLNIECPVKWTATQEKSFSCELPVSEISATSAAEHVVASRALLLVAALPVFGPSSSRSQAYGLFELVKPHLLTPRLVTAKYQKRISALFLRYEKGIHEDQDMSEEQQAAAYDSWKKTWLSHMEQREITIQLPLYFLPLTLPDIPRDEPKSRSTELMVPSPSPRKRVRASSPTKGLLSASILEQDLELLMDRLALWQLMTSIDIHARGDVTVRHTHRLQTAHKGRHRIGVPALDSDPTQGEWFSGRDEA
ncbi:hypothetical protein BC835DRAFT_1307560 [Cytidiella melzeri]|nr:hypothetical protein BC835DRAFT_1307560 [Cytidiella melzeri]